MRARFRTYGATHPGAVRTDNEDHFEMDSALGVYVVADGMGGHPDGEVASRLAIRALLDALCGSGSEDGRAAMEQAIACAHRRVRQANGPRTGADAMGTTLSALRVAGNGDFVFGNVGDSRAFYSSRGYDTPAVLQLSQEHTVAADLIRRGAPPHLLVDPTARSLTQAIGLGHHIRPRVIEGRIAPGEGVTLCTDGITDYVPAARLEDTIMRFGHDPEVAVKMLVAMALDGGGGDNCTCVCVYREA